MFVYFRAAVSPTFRVKRDLSSGPPSAPWSYRLGHVAITGESGRPGKAGRPYGSHDAQAVVERQDAWELWGQEDVDKACQMVLATGPTIAWCLLGPPTKMSLLNVNSLMLHKSPSECASCKRLDSVAFIMHYIGQ
jgi:hypothetical protein